MKDKFNNLIEEKLKRDSQYLKRQSQLDVKYRVLSKLKTQATDKNTNEIKSPNSKTFSFGYIAVGVSALVFVMVFFLQSNAVLFSTSPGKKTNNLSQISKQKENNPFNQNASASIAHSEKEALANDLTYLSKVFAL